MTGGRLAGRVAVVTGSGRPEGLGAAISARLAADGAAVVISDIGRPVDAATPAAMIGTSVTMTQVADALRSAGGVVSTHACDSVEGYLADMAARIPMGRPGLPDDTAAAVAFLASDEARYITAESLNVSGGEEPH